MFGFAPKLPVSTEARDWIDQSLERLASIYGQQTPESVKIICPTDEDFPERWDGTKPALELLLQRVCSYMRVDRQRVMLSLFEDDTDALQKELRTSMPYWEGASKGAAGLYREVDEQGNVSIAIKQNQLADLTSLIATLAHELGHVLLLADAKIPRDAKDMEPLTDLVTIFWGMGIFTANSAVNFKQYTDGSTHGWSVKRQGYLSEPMLGYALARFAMNRQEKNPKWASHLTLNVRTYFNQSQKFLARESRK